MSLVFSDKIQTVYQKPFPAEAFIECTGKCNLKCVHCYLGEKSALPILPFEKIKDILQQLYKLGTMQIKLSGGEPLTHPHIVDILYLIREMGMSTTLFTNATLLSPELMNVLKTTVNHVRVSIYGSTEKTYDLVTHTQGAYKNFLNGITLLQQSAIDTEASIILLRENIHEHQDMFYFCKEHGMLPNAGLRICPTRTGDQSVCSHEISNDDLVNAVRFIREVNHVPANDPDPEDRDSILNSHPCGAGVYAISIRCNGDVVPCVELGLKYGNVYSSSLADLYNSDISNFIKGLRVSDFSECSSCRLLTKCSICMDTLFKENGHVFPTKDCKICQETRFLCDRLSL